jgi:hypothetical protein
MKAIAASEAAKTNQSNSGGIKKMTLQELKAKLLELGIDFAEIERKAKKYDDLSLNFSEMETKFSSVSKENEKLQGELVDMKKKFEDADKKVAEIKFSSLVEQGMKEGKLTKVLADGKFKSIFDTMGHEFAENFLKDMPAVVSTKPTGNSAGNQETNASDVASKVRTIAKEIQKRDSISFSDAMSKALEENQELHSEWNKLGE